MRLYYRSDIRHPSVIFQQGFESKKPSFLFNHWWRFGIRNINLFSFPPKTHVSDAEMDHVICVSKKLESTPLFPVCDAYHTDYNSEIYIYVMVLPDAILPEDFDKPQNIDVFDMQAYQSQELQKILNDRTLSVNPAMTGYVLSGHEAFTKRVLTQNIICAVKCKRSDFALTAGLPVFTKDKDDAAKYAFCQTRYFEIGHEVFVNEKYSHDAEHKRAAIDELQTVRARGWQPTANVVDALDESQIKYDKNQIHTSTYFWQELTSLRFGMAFFSILESIYYAAIQLGKYMASTSAPKQPLEIVEHLPKTEQVSYKRKPLSFYGRYFTTIGLVTGEANPMDAYMITHM